MRAPNLRKLIHDIDGNRHGPKLTRVKVQFDNSDRKIPVDSDMVTITREMNDKGESEYHLDSKKINRNRLQDMFEMANADQPQLAALQIQPFFHQNMRGRLNLQSSSFFPHLTSQKYA